VNFDRHVHVQARGSAGDQGSIPTHPIVIRRIHRSARPVNSGLQVQTHPSAPYSRVLGLLWLARGSDGDAPAPPFLPEPELCLACGVGPVDPDV
jgi:hypothetical protein